MSDILDEVAIEYEYDVFIIYAGCDESKARLISSKLESKKLRCLAQWQPEAFKAGKPVFDNVIENMTKSQTTLLILTKDSFTTSWVTLETILALEHSVIRNHLTLRMILCDVKQSDADFLKKGILENVPDISVDFNKDDWLDELISRIRQRIEIPEILPVGCLAHGQVFSHFTGYLIYLLPGLVKRIEAHALYQQNPDNVLKKLVMLIPGSCKLPGTLDQLQSDSGIIIQKKDDLEFTAEHAGKKRDLKPMIYSVSNGKVTYFFIADLPNVLKSIFRIHKDGLARVDIRFQVARFYYTMNEVLNHSENHGCANKVLLVPFNDEVEHIADVVFRAVQDELMCQKAQTAMSLSPKTEYTPQRLMSRQDSYPKDVLICVSDDLEDSSTAMEITKYLQENKKTIAVKKTNFSDLNEGRWVIFIISKACLSSDKGLILQCLSVLVDSIHNNFLRTLPVLVDVEINDLPQIIKWVTLVSVKESNYMERLLQTINGGEIRVQDRLPSGDVATGLAWAYVLNYLILTLTTKTDDGLDFNDRVQKLLFSKQLSCGCIPKLFLLVPKSCMAKPDLAAEANKECSEPRIERVGSLDPVHVDTGGVEKRAYKLNMYKFTDLSTGNTRCFICEYCTPINCMHEMANSYPFAGLHKEDMYRQAEAFVRMFPSIVSREAVKKKLGDVSSLVQLIHYDDESKSLTSALQKEINIDNERPSDLLYAAAEEMMVLD